MAQLSKALARNAASRLETLPASPPLQISYGPCQTPTLGFTVARHLVILQHRPQSFWTISAEAFAAGARVRLSWERGRCFDEGACTLFKARHPAFSSQPLSAHAVGHLRRSHIHRGVGRVNASVVISLSPQNVMTENASRTTVLIASKTDETKRPPVCRQPSARATGLCPLIVAYSPFCNYVHRSALIAPSSLPFSSTFPSPPQPGLNTCDLLKALSNVLRIGPHQGLQMAERLYIQGYLSYPRTESTAYPPGFDLRGLVGDQTKHPIW